MKHDQQQEKSLAQEVREMIRDNAAAFLRWLKPAPQDPVVLQVIKTLFKLPVFLLVLVLSPVAFIILLFTFIAVL